MAALSICSGNFTCDARVPHICYNPSDVLDADPTFGKGLLSTLVEEEMFCGENWKLFLLDK